MDFTPTLKVAGQEAAKPAPVPEVIEIKEAEEVIEDDTRN